MVDVAWDARTGVEQLDRLLIHHFAAEFRQKHGKDLLAHPRALAKVKRQVAPDLQPAFVQLRSCTSAPTSFMPAAGVCSECVYDRSVFVGALLQAQQPGSIGWNLWIRLQMLTQSTRCR